MKVKDRIKVTVGVFKGKLGTITALVPEQEKCYCTVLDVNIIMSVWLRSTELKLV